jgi:hypothetical protein
MRPARVADTKPPTTEYAPMSDVTNPLIVSFVNERVRPNAERVRALLYTLDDLRAMWTNGDFMAAKAEHDSGDVIIDGHDDAPPLTIGDLGTFVNRMYQLQAVLEAANAMDVVHGACVRPIEITL